MEQLSYWAKGVRFYIALAVLLVTIEIVWWADALFSGTSLFAQRVEEIYAWLSVGSLFITLLITPCYRLFAQLPGKSLMRDARLALGFAAVWFALWYMNLARVRDESFNLSTMHEQPLSLFLISATLLLLLLYLVAHAKGDGHVEK
ncbi:MAG TPA: hypothetical protein VLH38_02430 [Patescibacteria group bacterium]|nr:hypothetical protein [Patescibacteria group bacterium]